MNRRDIIYEYDGSFHGLLCCIFESYTQKENPTAIICGEDEALSLFETRSVATVREHAERVSRSLRKLSPDVLPLLRRVFLTDLPEKELAIYRFVVKLYREGAPYLTRLSDETYQPLLRAVRSLSSEVEHLRGFLRFSVYDGMLGAEIEPKNRVLPLLRGHFCQRCHDETFFIYDRTHREALLYANGRSRIVPMDEFCAAPPDAEEAAYRRLWRRFYDTIAIRERENPRLRMTHMPKRFWKHMTEFQTDDPRSDAAGSQTTAPVGASAQRPAGALTGSAPSDVAPSPAVAPVGASAGRPAVSAGDPFFSAQYGTSALPGESCGAPDVSALPPGNTESSVPSSLVPSTLPSAPPDGGNRAMNRRNAAPPDGGNRAMNRRNAAPPS